jgi:hypothetical protein
VTRAAAAGSALMAPSTSCRMPRHARRHPAPLLAALLLLGCGGDDAVSPEGTAGRWALQRIAGDPLPAVSFTTSEITIRILGDTLLLNADGTGTLTGADEVERPELPPGERVTRQTRQPRGLLHRMVNGRVEVEYLCGPAELCVVPPHLVGRWRNGVLHVDYALGHRTPRVYTRVR